MNRVDAIVTVKWLADKIKLSPKNFRVLDGSWNLPNAKRNTKAEYASGHIPGAVFFDIDDCADKKATKLNHMLPKPAEFAAYVGRLGISNDTHVVVYDNSDRFPLFSAQRVWWTFRCFGHQKVSVLEGGLPKWIDSKNTLSDAAVEVPTEKFEPHFNPDLVKSFDQIATNQFKDKVFTLIDGRPAGRFEGTAPEPRPDIKPGRITGSINMPFPGFMDLEKQTYKSKEELARMFKQKSVDLSKPVVATCGSGISACHVALAAFICGKEDVAVYDGSWTEWFQEAKPNQMENVPKE